MTENYPKENIKCKRHENEVQKLLNYLFLFLSIPLKSYFLELFSQKSRHFMFFLQPVKKEDFWSILRNFMKNKVSMTKQGIVPQKIKQEKIIDLLNYALSDLFNKVLCKCPMSITGCWGSPSLSRTGSDKGRDLQSPKLFWDAIYLVFLTWIYAVCLECFLSVTAYQGQCCLNLNSGLLKIPKTVVPHLSLEKEWEVFTLLQKWCLSACSWGLSSYLYLSSSLPCQGKPYHSYISKSGHASLLGKAHRERGAVAVDCWFMGHATGGLEKWLLSLHWFMCLLYPTGTFAASVASPTVTGTQQQWLYPLQSDL